MLLLCSYEFCSSGILKALISCHAFCSFMMTYLISFQILDEFFEGFDSFIVETDRCVEPDYQIYLTVNNELLTLTQL